MALKRFGDTLKMMQKTFQVNDLNPLFEGDNQKKPKMIKSPVSLNSIDKNSCLSD